jgi:ATP-dependent Clp protease, protease subunit
MSEQAAPLLERTLTYFGSIRTPSSNGLRATLSGYVNEGTQKVTILFASDGGSTDDGIALYTYIKALPLEITMHAIGLVSSIAIPVFCAGKNRLASKNARFYFHDYSWTYGQPTTVSRTAISEPAILLDAAIDWSRETLKADTKLTDNDFKTMQLFQVPKIITASEAARYGIVTAVVEPKIDAAHRPLVQM